MESRLEEARSFRSEIVFTLLTDRCGDGEIPVGCILLEPDAPALPFLLLFFFNDAAMSANPLKLKSNRAAGDSAGDRVELLVVAAVADGGGGGVARRAAADEFFVRLLPICV